MTIAETRAYINAYLTANGLGSIDGPELNTALLALCENIEAAASWTPVFSVVPDGTRYVLKITDWTGGVGIKPAVNVYMGATGYVSTIAQAVDVRGATGPQGLPGSGVLGDITQPPDGRPTPRYWPICELPAPAGGTYDFAQIELVAKDWADDLGSLTPVIQRLYVSNRSGFNYRWAQEGDLKSAFGLVAYRLADNRVIVYAKSDNFYRALSWRVPNSMQATIYSTVTYLGEWQLAGTKVFDATDPGVYPPMQVITPRFVYQYPRNGGGVHFPPLFTTPGDASLAVGSNAMAGPTEVDLINSTYLGYAGGFAFYQQKGASSLSLLAYLRGVDGWLGLGTNGPMERLHVEGNTYQNGSLVFAQTALNKKISLFGSMNDHQYYGMGISTNTLRYHISSSGDSHVFYAGSSPATSVELMRITGSGTVGINNLTPTAMLDIQPKSGASTLRLGHSNTLLESWLGYSDGKNYLRSTTILADTQTGDRVGVGTVNPLSKLHVKGAFGYNQLNLENNYTPTGSNDPNGSVGDICFDLNCMYRKFASVGWKRIGTFSTF